MLPAGSRGATGKQGDGRRAQRAGAVCPGAPWRNHPPETTGRWVAAKFAHDSARPVNGYAAPQVHTHVGDSPLAGLKLVGFGVWERRGGIGRNVTFPARQCSINGQRRSFALLRPVVDTTAQNALRDLILEAFAEYEETVAADDRRDLAGRRIRRRWALPFRRRTTAD